MALRLVALAVGLMVGLYRFRRHGDEWGACVFYGFLAACAVHGLGGLGLDEEADYGWARRDR